MTQVEGRRHPQMGEATALGMAGFLRVDRMRRAATKSATGGAAVLANFAVGDSTGPASAVVQASGQQVTANG